jgi:hypothetical protein
MGRPFSEAMESFLRSVLSKEKDERPVDAQTFFHYFEAAAQHEQADASAWSANPSASYPTTGHNAPTPALVGGTSIPAGYRSYGGDTPSGISYAHPHENSASIPAAQFSYSHASPYGGSTPPPHHYTPAATEEEDEVGMTMIETHDIPSSPEEDPVGETMMINRTREKTEQYAWPQHSLAQSSPAPAPQAHHSLARSAPAPQHQAQHSLARSASPPQAGHDDPFGHSSSHHIPKEMRSMRSAAMTLPSTPSLEAAATHPHLPPHPAPASPSQGFPWKILIWAMLLGILLGGASLLAWQWLQK